MIYEKAYAKINLALEVTEKVDGYHKVANLMIPISLYDEIFLEKSNVDIIECESDIKDNICLKALELFKEKFDIKECVHLILKKNIPMMAGLAGGSSDAAATLKGLNRLFNVNASYEDLYEIACQLGSDVPFFLKTKPAVCTGRGEIINPLDFDIPGVPLLLVKPSFGCSTKEIYANYQFNGISRLNWIKKLVEGLKENNIDVLEEYTFNDLEGVALKLYPKLKEIMNKISDLSYNPHVSGSGPTIFILGAKSIDLENLKDIDDGLNFYLCHFLTK